MGGGALGGWGALIQRGTQWADRGFNYGMYRMQRDDYASQVRHLRRREYQDMMFSMKAAGLNPILAAGAAPGHSAAYMGHGVADGGGVDLAGAISAGMKAEAAQRQAGAAERGVKVKEVMTPYEVGNKMVERYYMAAQMGLTDATTAKTRAETELALQESGTAAIKRHLMMRQAEQAGISAKELEGKVFLQRGDPRWTVSKMLQWAEEKDRANATARQQAQKTHNPFGAMTYPHLRK